MSEGIQKLLFYVYNTEEWWKRNMGKEGQAVMKLREIFKGRFPVVCSKINEQ